MYHFHSNKKMQCISDYLASWNFFWFWFVNMYMNPDPNHRPWNSFSLRFFSNWWTIPLVGKLTMSSVLKQLIKWSDYWYFTLWVWGLNLGGWKGKKRNVKWIYMLTKSVSEMCSYFLWIWKWYISPRNGLKRDLLGRHLRDVIWGSLRLKRQDVMHR